jgi:hypothetical protein
MRGPDFVLFDAANLPPNDSIAPRAIVTMALSYSAACITLGLRLWCGGIKSRKLGWDDGMIVLAMVRFHSTLSHPTIHSLIAKWISIGIRLNPTSLQQRVSEIWRG